MTMNADVPEISFGEWLHQRRRILDLTQQALADQVGCAHITLRRIESGSLKPSKELALILLEKLGAPANNREAWVRFARGLSGFPEASSRAHAHKPITNLPASLTSFIGREDEITEVVRLLDKARLVTLTGPGGTGKTRLSIQVANELLDQYSDGVWMVELGPIVDPSLVPRTTAIAVGLRDEPHRPVIDMLCDYLGEKELLLVLDNCEHLVEACAHMVDQLLRSCPHVRILASSREPLDLAGETSYPVPSLALPEIESLPPIESLTQYEAIQLFIDRATSAVPTFTLTDENALAIAQICHRLDGIPLAIELAAGKIRALSPGQIAQRLDQRFHLLTGGSRTALPRHRTLRAAMEWSYNLLSPREQTLFRRLSVFVNGWTLEAAEAVCADELLRPADILDILTQLVNKSLVMTQETHGEFRYYMLETIRHFGNDKLLESNESEELREGHLDYFLQWAETAEPHLTRAEQLEWLRRLEADYENLRAALEWSLSQESPESSLQLCVALRMFWLIRSFWMEGSRWLQSALSKKSEHPTPAEQVARARALYQDAELAQNLDDIERMSGSAELSLALAQESHDRRDLAIAGLYVGSSWRRRGDDERARQWITDSLSEFRELEDRYWENLSHNMLNAIRIRQDDLNLSDERMFREALDLARKAGERSNLAEALLNYVRWLLIFNRVKEAQEYTEEAEWVLSQVGANLASISQLFAQIALLENDYPGAREFYVDAQASFGLIGEKNQRSSVMEDLGHLEIDEGHVEQAQIYLTEALATAREMEKKASIASRLVKLAIAVSLQGKLEEAKQHFRECLSLARELRSFRKINVLILTVNYIPFPQEKVTVHILGAIDQSQRENQRPINPLRKRYYDQVMTSALDRLGEEKFQSAFAKGQKMSLDQALDLAWKTIDELKPD